MIFLAWMAIRKGRFAAKSSMECQYVSTFVGIAETRPDWYSNWGVHLGRSDVVMVKWMR